MTVHSTVPRFEDYYKRKQNPHYADLPTELQERFADAFVTGTEIEKRLVKVWGEEKLVRFLSVYTMGCRAPAIFRETAKGWTVADK